MAGALFALLAGGGSPARAQDAGALRPYRGLFGNASEATARHKLDATTSVTAAYDSELPPDLGSTGLPQPESVGQSTMLTTGVQYKWTGRPVQVEASGTGAVRYYPAVDDIRTVNAAGSIAMTATLPARSAMALSQTATFTPSYLYNLFPQAESPALLDTPTPISPDYAVNGTESVSYGTAATFAYNPLGRNSLVASADQQQMETTGGVGAAQSMNVQAVQGQYARRLRRNMTASALYRYRRSDIAQGIDLASPGKFIEHGVEIGMQYRRALSASRQLSFDGRIGSALLRIPESLRVRSVRQRPYRFLGDLTVGYRFKRSWQANGSYRGSIQYVPGIVVPVSTDGMTGTVEGFLTRRLNLLASAAYSNGESTWTPNSVSFSSYTGNVRGRLTLTSAVAVYGEYLYYFYDFRGTLQLAPGIPRLLERSGLRAGFTLLIPVLRSR